MITPQLESFMGIQIATLPAAMDTPRYEAKRRVELPHGEIPLIDPRDPDHKKVRERHIAHARVFDLLVTEQADEYQKIWQKVCDGLAMVSDSPSPVYDGANGKYLAFLRWSELAYVAPGNEPA